MNGLFTAARSVQRFCQSRSWPFCFIGGLAVQRWGEPRQTLDVDLTVLTGFGGEEPYIDALLEGFPARIDEPKTFALRNRVLLLATSDGVGIDVAMGALPFESRAVERASNWDVMPGITLRTCGPEDLVVYKGFAGRPLDWNDIEMVVARQRGHLDAGLIVAELEPLLALKEAPGDLARLENILADGDR